MRLIKITVKTVVAVFLLLSVLLTGCAPSLVFKSFNIEANINYFSVSNEYRSMPKRGSVEVAVGDGISLFYDEKSGGVSLFDRNGGKSWNSLPQETYGQASNFYVKVLKDEKIYILDTAANCAAKKGLSYSLIKDGIRVIYKMTADDISVELPVSFTLDGAYVNVETDISECKVSDDVKIISVSVLPYLGALAYSDDASVESFADYYVLPDASGAVLHTALEDENFTSAVFSVYGKDYYEEYVPAFVAAYGVRSGQNVLSATVTEGDENSLIRVLRSNYDDSGINRVFTEFIITPVSAENGKCKVGKSYEGKIKVCYETVTGDDADYISIAFSVRQALINAGKMPFDTVDEEYPLFISVINTVDGSKKSTVTSFQQTENLLSILKGKGVNSVNLILEGAFSGGLLQKKADSIAPLTSPGGRKALNELCSYADSQQFNVFGAIGLMSSSSSAGALRGISGEKLQTTFLNPIYPYYGDESYELYYTSPDRLTSSVSSVIDVFSKTGIDGICISDSMNSCLADYTDSEMCFGDFTENYNSALSPLHIDSLIMLDGCNMNIVKNADYIRNIPFETSIEEGVSYKAVPFLPAIIHSSFIYSGNTVNSNGYSVLNLLKCVEYGALPHYRWCFESKTTGYYETEINDAVEFYVNAVKNLSDLSDKRIVEHFQYDDGVYCTGYEGGVRIYVNYNNYSVIIGEIAIMPYDYIRIG